MIVMWCHNDCFVIGDDDDDNNHHHYGDIIINTMASQITSISIVCSTVCSGTDQRNIKVPRHWPLWGESTIYWWIPLTKGQSREKWFHLMTSSWVKSSVITEARCRVSIMNSSKESWAYSLIVNTLYFNKYNYEFLGWDFINDCLIPWFRWALSLPLAKAVSLCKFCPTKWYIYLPSPLGVVRDSSLATGRQDFGL